MANTSIGNYGSLAGLAGYGQSSTAPSATVLAKVEQTLAGQTGNVAKLNQSITRDQTRLSALGQLQSALAGFQGVAERLAGSGLSTTAQSSAKDVATAAAGGEARPGAYALEVKQLAQGQVLNSGAVASSTAKIGTGANATVKIETAAGTKSVTIDSKNNTLDGMAAAFKAAGVEASVVKSGNGYALQLQGASGEANAMRLSVSGDAAVKSLLSYNPSSSGQGMTEAVAAQDAVALVDGKEIKSAANTLKDAIPGATLTLAGKGKSEVTVSQDSSQIAQNVSAFVTAYNDLAGKLAELQKGDLKSNLALNQASRDLGSLLRTGSVSPSALAAAGVSQDANGKLQLDDKQLQAAITADPAAVAKLFTNDGKGLADQFDARIDALNGKSGAIARETQQVGKGLDTLNTKKTELAKALTTQAQVLAQFYTQQEQSGANGALPGYTGGPKSLFDFFA